MSDAPKPRVGQIISLFGKEAVNESEWLSAHEFNPDQLLDALTRKMRLENDAALANKLEVIQRITVMIRDGTLSVTPSFLFAWIQDVTGIQARELHDLMNRGRTET